MTQTPEQSALILTILEPEETGEYGGYEDGGDEDLDYSDLVSTVVLFSKGYADKEVMAKSARGIRNDFFRALDIQESNMTVSTPGTPDAGSCTDNGRFGLRSEWDPSIFDIDTAVSRVDVESMVTRAVKSMEGVVPTFISIVGSSEFDRIVAKVQERDFPSGRWAEIDFRELQAHALQGRLLDTSRSADTSQP